MKADLVQSSTERRSTAIKWQSSKAFRQQFMDNCSSGNCESCESTQFYISGSWNISAEMEDAADVMCTINSLSYPCWTYQQTFIYRIFYYESFFSLPSWKSWQSKNYKIHVTMFCCYTTWQYRWCSPAAAVMLIAVIDWYLFEKSLNVKKATQTLGHSQCNLWQTDGKESSYCFFNWKMVNRFAWCWKRTRRLTSSAKQVGHTYQNISLVN